MRLQQRPTGLFTSERGANPPLQSAMEHLQRLYMDIRRRVRPDGRPSGLTVVEAKSAQDQGWLLSMFSRRRGEDSPVRAALAGVQGLYLYGGVGCGKTMLMDVFVRVAPEGFKVK